MLHLFKKQTFGASLTDRGRLICSVTFDRASSINLLYINVLFIDHGTNQINQS